MNAADDEGPVRARWISDFGHHQSRPCTEYPNVVFRLTSPGVRVGDGAWGAAAIADVPAVGAAREGSVGANDDMGVGDDDT